MKNEFSIYRGNNIGNSSLLKSEWGKRLESVWQKGVESFRACFFNPIAVVFEQLLCCGLGIS